MDASGGRAMTMSQELHKQACSIMPGGVNSPVRAFHSVGGTPVFFARGNGAAVTDVDGNDYLDYVGSWGPLILGHAHPKVVEAVSKAARNGLSFGACHAGEIALAECIHQCMPHIEMLRLVNSGTEAAMSALRLARAATRRDAFIKFEGCYHGHADSFLIQAGSGALTFGEPNSPGVTTGSAGSTLVAEFNNLQSVAAQFDSHSGEIACVIVEPVACNMGVVLPDHGFLAGLRDLCDQHDALLIFDEVITGFRLGTGGAAQKYDVTPDLTLLGKIIGGGMPVGAYGGRRDLMQQMSPTGPVYQAGTLSGNPLATAAGLATLEVLIEEDPYPELAALTDTLVEGTAINLKDAGLQAAQNSVESISSTFFGIEEAGTFPDVSKCDTRLFARYHAAMLSQGIYLAPSQFEATFISTAHTPKDIERTLEAQSAAFKTLA